MPQKRQGRIGAELVLFDVLGARWALRVLWELGGDPLTYRGIAERVPGLSTSVLTRRIRELRAAGLIEHESGAGYRLTKQGQGVLTYLTGLAEWAQRARFGPRSD
ncbi:MAG: helix-turn-helix domain-containing protein [Streptosporangiales bacterium]|nr:helix-turn-helix domain-containing protein [Streptosporangiales bacterium]